MMWMWQLSAVWLVRDWYKHNAAVNGSVVGHDQISELIVTDVNTAQQVSFLSISLYMFNEFNIFDPLNSSYPL